MAEDKKIKIALVLLVIIFLTADIYAQERTDLARFVKDNIKQKAQDVAKQIEIYLKANPDKSAAELQNDSYFLEIAVQPVGKTGYTAITDYDKLITIAHVNPKMVGMDLSTLEKKLPGFWSIMAPTKGGYDSEGFYDWEDEDGTIREKYMYIAVVKQKTADNIGLHVAATTYLDDYEYFLEDRNAPLSWTYTLAALAVILLIYIIFYKRISPKEEKLEVRKISIKKKLLISFGTIILFIFLIAIVSNSYMQKLSVADSQRKISETASSANNMIISLTLLTLIGTSLIGLILSSSIVKPISGLYFAAKELEKGNFSTTVNLKTGDELEELGHTLDKAIKRLNDIDKEHKQLDNAKTEFLSITSHELRSPMTPMKAQLQMLLGGYFGKINKKQKESIDIVLRNTSRLDNIIQDFLEISRIEAARLKFKFIKTDLTEYINRLIDEMRGFMQEKNISIICNIGKLPAIEVDPDRVMQVLRNLINNAIKFSPENSTISVEAILKNGMIRFMVKDNGIGISSADRIRLFEPFFQAEQTMYRKHGGTGLGLAICKGIVEAQNGRIWLESIKGKGSAFYFTVPLAPVKEMKPIKVLFSQKGNIEKKIKELFIEYLGPLGGKEFEALMERQISYETSIEYMRNLNMKGIIDQDSLNKIDNKLISVFGVKKVINVPEAVNKKYIDILGPLGKKRFDRLGSLTPDKILGDINYLERNKILDSAEASMFRDYIVGLFRQKELGADEETSEPREIKSEEEIPNPPDVK